MRTPSGPSSHGPELTSHYGKDNAEERISNSAQDTLKINQGSVTHYTALLISYFFWTKQFSTAILVLSLHKVPYLMQDCAEIINHLTFFFLIP